MKLNKIAAALALVAAGAPAFAAISTGDNPELFAVVWDEAVGSYTQDLGISLNTFLSAPSSFSIAVGASYASYAAADTVQTDGDPANLSGTRWAIFAIDRQSSANPGDYRYLQTGTNGAGAPPRITNGDFSTAISAMGGTFVGAVNLTGSHIPAAANGDSYNPTGSFASFNENDYLGQYGPYAGNAIGATGVSLFSATNNAGANALNAVSGPLAGVASFDGTTFSYTVAAVPEPGSIALLLAGLSAFGFVGRRVNRRD